MKDFFYCSQSSLCVILILLVTAFMRIVDVLNTDMGINSCLNFSKSTLLLHLTIQMCVNITVAAGRLLWRGLSWKRRGTHFGMCATRSYLFCVVEADISN